MLPVGLSPLSSTTGCAIEKLPSLLVGDASSSIPYLTTTNLFTCAYRAI